MIVDSIKNKFLFFGVAIGTLIFIISSGGPSVFRVFGLLIAGSSFMVHLLKNESKLSPYILAACCSFCITFGIGVVKSTLFGTDLSAIYYLTIVLIFLLPFFIILYSSYSTEYLNKIIRFISWVYITLFLIIFLTLLFLRQQFGANLLIFLNGNEYFEGLYYRPFLQYENYPAVWFQFSILAMPFAIWNLYAKNKSLFILLAIIVFLSLNRTGSFIIILFYLASLIKQRQITAKFFLGCVFILPIVFFIFCAIIHAVYGPDFVNDGSGLDIRIGHVISVFDNLYKDNNFFFGMGADAPFSTLGRQDAGLVRDQEISFLEVLRRFGMVGYIFFNLGLNLSLLFFYNKKNWPSFYSLLVYIIFSFTNPSLISMIFIVFYSIIASTDIKNNGGKLYLNNLSS